MDLSDQKIGCEGARSVVDTLKTNHVGSTIRFHNMPLSRSLLLDTHHFGAIGQPDRWSRSEITGECTQDQSSEINHLLPPHNDMPITFSRHSPL